MGCLRCCLPSALFNYLFLIFILIFSTSWRILTLLSRPLISYGEKKESGSYTKDSQHVLHQQLQIVPSSSPHMNGSRGRAYEQIEFSFLIPCDIIYLIWCFPITSIIIIIFVYIPHKKKIIVRLSNTANE